MFANPIELYSLITLTIIAAVQLFYYWYFFARLWWYKPKPVSSTRAVAVSIIICARDEAKNLLQNLPGILAQAYPYTHELVIVNDNSFDDTQYILEEFKKTYKYINVIQLSEQAKFVQGKKFPLSVGIKSSKYEILLLTDADCTPATELWLQSMQQAFTPETEIVLGYGAYRKQKGLLNKIIRFETLHTAMQYLSYSLAGITYMGVGRNLAYKKGLFTAHKGFTAHHHIPSGDDDLFVNAAATPYNTAINIAPESFTYSNPKTTWKAWITQKLRHISTSKHYHSRHKILLGLYTMSQLLIYPALIIALLLSTHYYIPLAIYGLRTLSMVMVWCAAMHKLHERDLKPWCMVFDVWLSIYFLIFAPALLKKTKSGWN